MNTKIKWLRDKINMHDMQGMILSNPINIKYLTNIKAEGTLLITRKENIFITDGRYIEEVRHTLTIDDEIIVCNISEISQEDYENFFMFCENVGFEENYLTYAKYKKYKQQYRINNFEETEYLVEKQRMIKEEEEIRNIKKACEITDACFSYLLETIKIGKTEKQIANEIEEFFREQGADGLAFDSIVASGKNSSKPHAMPTDKKIEPGDPITIDMGCKYNGYCSDMTRTIFAKNVPQEIKNIYDLVLKNHSQTIKELKESANIRIIAKMVENDLKLHGYEMQHALGHGVGLEIHELPYISGKVDKKLKENMIITSEPGIYIPEKFGVRIEDTIQVTKAGGICLTQSPRNYIIVDENG